MEPCLKGKQSGESEAGVVSAGGQSPGAQGVSAAALSGPGTPPGRASAQISLRKPPGLTAGVGGWVVSRVRTHFLWTRACADPMLGKTAVRKLCLVPAWMLIL